MQVNKEIWNNSILLLNNLGIDTPFVLDVRDSCSSTMDLAKEYLKSKELDSSKNKVFISLTQNKGRGRSDRVWESDLGGLYMTIAITEPIQYENTTGLPLVVGGSLVKVLSSYNLKVGLKWPNDVLDSFSLKKLAGILVESVSASSNNLHNSCLISIGIGLNINQTNLTDSNKFISMKTMSNKEFNFEEVSLKLASQVIQDFKEFSLKGFEKFKNFWTLNSCMKNLDISYFDSLDLEKRRELGVGIFKEISDSGSLILNDKKSDNLIELHSGEVSISISKKQIC